jgi:hypothetical protein
MVEKVTKEAKSMRAGMVVSIRVNPKDCQSVLDVMNKVGININGHSFSQLVSLSLSSMLEAQRLEKNIPEPDEFQFLHRLEPFMGQQRTSKKMKVAKLLHEGGGKVRAPALPKRSVIEAPTMQTGAYVPAPVTAEQREAGRRLTELLQKKDLSDVNPQVVWQAADQHEHDQLMAVVYPEG